MHLSLGTRIKVDTIGGSNGYGYATLRMVDSLRRLGHTVDENDPTAPVEMWFDQPHHWNFSSPYKIGYHPWESTRLLDDWVERMNKCDEIWTPSPLIADWYKDDGVKAPVYVYEHGVDHEVWTPHRRDSSDKIRFLHVGAEATRKGGWDVMRLFRTAFYNRDDVELTLKVINSNWLGIGSVGKISILNGKYSLPQMVDLFQSHHVYVYPSWGEGFGLTPLQAMATGMPTICTAAWAPYERFLDPKLKLDSTLTKSLWGQIHPGKMFKPNWDELIDQMRYVADNYEDLHTAALGRVDQIKAEYDWDTLTQDAFESLESRL